MNEHQNVNAGQTLPEPTGSAFRQKVNMTKEQAQKALSDLKDAPADYYNGVFYSIEDQLRDDGHIPKDAPLGTQVEETLARIAAS